MASPPSPNSPTANEHNESSQDHSAESSNTVSREGGQRPRKKHNVRFTAGGESLDAANQRTAFDLRDDTNAPPKPRPRRKPKLDEGIFQRSRDSLSLRRPNNEKSEDITNETARAPLSKVRPSIMRLPWSELDWDERHGNRDQKENQKKAEMSQNESDEDEEDEDQFAKAFSQKSAQNRAERLSRLMGSHSAPGSRYTSPQRSKTMVVRSPPRSPTSDDDGGMPLDLNDLPLEKLESRRRKFGIEDDTEDDEGLEEEGIDIEKEPRKKRKKSNHIFNKAAQLFKQLPGGEGSKQPENRIKAQELPSGMQTPIAERDPDNYVPRPTEYKEGYLSSLLKLYDQDGLGTAIFHIPSGSAGAARAVAKRTSSVTPLLRNGQDGAADTPTQTPVTTPGGSPISSGTTTPRLKHQKWYYKNEASQSTGALSDLVSSSTVLAHPGGSKQSSVVRPKPKQRPLSHQALEFFGKKKPGADDASITIHLADLGRSHEYLQKMCRALMSYGAPTHRLEGRHYRPYYLSTIANSLRVHEDVCEGASN